MKKLLISSAAAIALMATPAFAGDKAEMSDTADTMTEVTYTTTDYSLQTSDTVDLDSLSIEELNEWQLAQLNRQPVYTTASTRTYVEPVTTRTYVAPATETYIVATKDSVTVTEPMGGPDFATRDDAITAYAAERSISEIAMDDPQFSTLVSLLKKAELADDLMDEGPFTVFAPTNAAFEKLPADVRAELMSDAGADELAAILKAHVLSGKYLKSDIPTSGVTLKTIGQSELMIEADEAGEVAANDIAIAKADISAANGVIHVVNDVIVPEGVLDPTFGTVLDKKS